MKTIKFEYKITAIYLTVGILWIIFSDSFLKNMVTNENLLTFFQSVKGIFYVTTTSILLFFLIRKNTQTQSIVEEQLVESKEKYKSLYEQAPLAYQSLNTDGNFIDINPQWCTTLGYNREEVIGKWFGDFLHPDYVEHFRINFPKFKKNGSVSGVQFQMKRKDGSFIFVSYEGCIGYNTDGSMKQTYCTFKDITTEYIANQKLIENEERFKTLFYDNISNMLIIDSESGQILFANNAAIKFYGYSINEIKELKISDINTLSVEEINFEMQNAVNNRQNYFKFKHQLSNGEIRDVEVYSSKIKLQGKILLYSIINDITKQLQLENDLIEAKENAERSDRLKSTFLANMSHEIRTPLNGVLGFASLLSEEELPQVTVKRYSDIINKSGQRLLDLINNLLDISKIESGNMPVKITDFKPFDVVQEVANLFSIKAKEKNLEIQLDISSELENLIIKSDLLFFNQILSNIVGNAIKFCENGAIQISYRVLSNNIEFCVSDNGPGISQDKQGELFERFYQVNQSLSRKHEGSGLGLALCKLLVNLLHGRIWLNSKLGEGSSFYFTIPTTIGIENISGISIKSSQPSVRHSLK